MSADRKQSNKAHTSSTDEHEQNPGELQLSTTP